MRIKGSLFVDLPKSYQKPSAEKKVMAKTPKGLCADSRANREQKGLAKGSHLGKVQFYQKNIENNTILLA